MKKQKLLNVILLLGIFRIFDPDGTGTIPTSEMRTVMTTLGEKLTPEEVNAMLKEADPDNTGKIDYASYVTFTTTIPLIS